MELRNIKGIGELMATRIIKQFGSEKSFIEAARNYEVDRLALVDGLSHRRAVEIINEILGNPREDFLKTKRAFQLYEDIIGRILDHASTDYARNRVLLLSPIKEPDKILKNMDLVIKARDEVKNLPRTELKKLLKSIRPLQEPKIHIDHSKALLVENSMDYEKLMERGLNKHYSLLTMEELEGIHEYELVIYAYTEGVLEFDDVHNVSMVAVDSFDMELVPETILKYYQANRETIENACRFRQLMKWESILDDVVNILDSLVMFEVDESLFNRAVDAAKDTANQKMKESIKKVDLSGDEVLDLLNQDLPEKIQKILDQVLEEAREQVYEATGCDFNPFLSKYPLEIDEDEIERIKKIEIGRQHLKAFDDKVNAAKLISDLEHRINKEVQEVLEFDYQFTLGSFALEYDLNKPVIGKGFKFEGALHLNLIGEKNRQRIDYDVKYPENVVLLTGANSGGKTTLLETLSQIVILTQLGLPVPAQYAQVEIIEELYFFSKRRSLDAGAFESFLRNFVPVATLETNKLILLDELEAITELEAAVKIISSFMELIQQSGSYAVIVTHLASEIMKYIQVRVDGIEATGLDENYNLIVDRTPRMDYLARSTPELILRRVYEKSDGKVKKIYGNMLKRF